MQTKKHVASTQALTSSQSHLQYKKTKDDETTHVAEARWALMVAMHTSINVVDHVTQTLKTTCKDSTVATSMQLGRTKCSAIIKNVWGPFFRRDLREDVDGFYSVLIDESTDKSTIKQLGIVIKYFSKRQQQIVGRFLTLEPIKAGDALCICTALKKVLNEFGLDLQRCSGNYNIPIFSSSYIYFWDSRDTGAKTHQSSKVLPKLQRKPMFYQ